MPQQNACPNWTVPLVEDDQRASQAWFNFFSRLTAKPPPIVAIVSATSPFTFTASQNGTVSISGGTVSSITLGRARVTGVNVGFTSGLVPVSQGDTVTVTYSVAPVMNFIPS
jgi:hypothetical protein